MPLYTTGEARLQVIVYISNRRDIITPLLKIGLRILKLTWIRSNSHSNLPQTPLDPDFFLIP